MKVFNETLAERRLVFDDMYKLKKIIYEHDDMTYQIACKDDIVLVADLSKVNGLDYVDVHYSDLSIKDVYGNVKTFNVKETLNIIKEINSDVYRDIVLFIFKGEQLNIDKDRINTLKSEFITKYKLEDDVLNKDLLDMLNTEFIEDIRLDVKTSNIYDETPVTLKVRYGDDVVEVRDLFYSWDGEKLCKIKTLDKVIVNGTTLVNGAPLKQVIPKDTKEVIRVFLGKKGIRRRANGIVIDIYEPPAKPHSVNFELFKDQAWELLKDE